MHSVSHTHTHIGHLIPLETVQQERGPLSGSRWELKEAWAGRLEQHETGEGRPQVRLAGSAHSGFTPHRAVHGLGNYRATVCSCCLWLKVLSFLGETVWSAWTEHGSRMGRMDLASGHLPHRGWAQEARGHSGNSTSLRGPLFRPVLPLPYPHGQVVAPWQGYPSLPWPHQYVQLSSGEGWILLAAVPRSQDRHPNRPWSEGN